MKFRRSGMLAVAHQAFFTLDMVEAPIQFATPFTLENGVAVVCVRGMLTHHKEAFSLDCYDDIQARIDLALACPEASAVLLRVDSLGGDVSGCFDLATHIRNEATRAGKRLLAYVEGHAASAAYALASTADIIGVGQTGFVGSIGVINAICDQSAADAAMGVRFVFATSGARKGDGNPHIPVSDETILELQRQVDSLALVFYNHVSERRGLSTAEVAGFQAGLFFGSGAVASRLADRVCSFAEMVSAASESLPMKVTAMPKYSEQMKEMLVKMAVDGDDDEKASAAKLLKALEPDKEEAAGDGEKKTEEKAAAPEDKDAEAKAAAAKAAEEDKDVKAAAAAHSFDIAKAFYELKAKLEAKEESEARASLLATRPDFDHTTRSFLATLPVSKVAEACKTFPKVGAHPAAAASAIGTRGSHSPAVSSDLASHIASKMMGSVASNGVYSTDNGKSLEFGNMTPEQARARLAELAKGTV